MIRPQEIGYSDELLADGTVHRRYEDGREEWRRREGARHHLVRWHDNRSASGIDELLGNRVIKRTFGDGTVTYARDIGYGRTLWGRGETVTVNRTSFGGRMGAVLAGLGVAGLGVAGLAVTAAQLPPLSMSPEEEEELRRQRAQGESSSGGSGDSGDGGDADWDDGEDSWSDDDFG
ncbi:MULTISPECIES: hypothetical protein [unclassified Streptomyces]|uniref:hypothetical protein n=1 Tax=unclassified Streptomyces TaxID=2593676 RepID=UPI0036F0D546